MPKFEQPITPREQGEDQGDQAVVQHSEQNIDPEIMEKNLQELLLAQYDAFESEVEKEMNREINKRRGVLDLGDQESKQLLSLVAMPLFAEKVEQGIEDASLPQTAKEAALKLVQGMKIQNVEEWLDRKNPTSDERAARQERYSTLLEYANGLSVNLSGISTESLSKRGKGITGVYSPYAPRGSGSESE